MTMISHTQCFKIKNLPASLVYFTLFILIANKEIIHALFIISIYTFRNQKKNGLLLPRATNYQAREPISQTRLWYLKLHFTAVTVTSKVQVSWKSVTNALQRWFFMMKEKGAHS